MSKQINAKECWLLSTWKWSPIIGCGRFWRDIWCLGLTRHDRRMPAVGGVKYRVNKET